MISRSSQRQHRLAAALAHGLDGARLRYRSPNGTGLVISHDADANLTPCQFRTLVAQGSIGSRPARIEFCPGGRYGVADSGSLADRNEGHVRWLAVELDVETVASALEAMEYDQVPLDAVNATLKPDPTLGVTLVGLSLDAPCRLHLLDCLVEHTNAALLVAELEEMLYPAALPAGDHTRHRDSRSERKS